MTGSPLSALRATFPKGDSIERKIWELKEKVIEQKLVSAVKAAGGICPKLVCPGMAGMPDRLVLLPDGKMGFVEVKAPGEKPRPLQIARHRILSWLGYRVFVLDEPEQVAHILDEIRNPAPSASPSPLPSSGLRETPNDTFP